MTDEFQPLRGAECIPVKEMRGSGEGPTLTLTPSLRHRPYSEASPPQMGTIHHRHPTLLPWDLLPYGWAGAGAQVTTENHRQAGTMLFQWDKQGKRLRLG